MVHHAVGVFEVLEFFEDDGYFSHCVCCLMFEFLIAMCVIFAVLHSLSMMRENWFNTLSLWQIMLSVL